MLRPTLRSLAALTAPLAILALALPASADIETEPRGPIETEPRTSVQGAAPIETEPRAPIETEPRA